MKPASPELLALLSSRQFFRADLWTFTLQSGVVLCYCGGDADIVANGNTYSAGGLTGPYFDRQDSKAKLHQKVGTGVDTLVVDVLPGAATVAGDRFVDAIRKGLFDGAGVLLERAYMPTWGDTRVGVVRMFQGYVADVPHSASIAAFNINSPLERLNLSLPRNVAQITCMNQLGDAVCGVNLASFSATGTVGAVADRSNFECTLSGSFPAGTFDKGKLVFTSGALSGWQATIKTCAPTSPGIALLGFLPIAPTAGDTFTIYYGCNKSYTDSNGCGKFSNQPRYRGFKFIPQPSMAI